MIRPISVSTTALAVALALSGATLAQDNQQPSARPEMSQQQRQDGEPPVILLREWNYDTAYSTGWSARRLMDEVSVYGPTGEDIGSIENLVIDTDGQLLGIVAEVGGFLDIGDTHVFVPWDSLEVGPGLDLVRIPITEDNVEEYSTWADSYLRRSETGRTQVVHDDLLTGPRIWKATELLGDDAVLTGNTGYGTVHDLVFTADGHLHAIIVNAYAGYRGGYRAFPFYGYDYGWDPGYPAYYLGYGEDQVSSVPAFDYDRINGNLPFHGRLSQSENGAALGEPALNGGAATDSGENR